MTGGLYLDGVSQDRNYRSKVFVNTRSNFGRVFTRSSVFFARSKV
jgi:hypothetical protein